MTTPQSIQVPREIVQKWQEIVDLLAEIMRVPSALIMKVEPPNIRVLVSSESKGNPYEHDEVAGLNTGLYCETVMSTRRPLLVPDALVDDDWKSNPDVKLGMISYLGFPISWPDGEIFGTICVLDNKKNDYGELYRKLLLQCRDMLQADLRSLATVDAALHESEEQWRAAFECNPTMYFIVDASGTIVSVNPFGAEQLGYEISELIGQPVLNVFLAADREFVQRNAAACFERLGQTMRWEARKLRKDGTVLWVRETANAVVLKNRPVLLVVCEDITENKRAEETLCKTQAELAHVARVATLGELTASIAHELNQPLGAIVNNASAALRWLRAQNLDEARRSVELAIEEGHRAGEIIKRIRSFALKAPPQKDWIDINETIREVVALARNEAQNNRVSIRTRLASNLPLVFGDRIQLQQVVLNLMMNAIEAMSGVNEERRDLLITSEKDASSRARIGVRDSGPGLAVTSLDDIFTPFYTTKPQGMGMGLSICRSIVEAHGGRLWATGNDDRGATFYFCLPRETERTHDPR